MIRKLLKEESGYSLVEVIVSMFILAIAIIPMVGMFDMGLKSATTSGNYDKARSLANLKLEQAKSMSFADARNQFPDSPATTTYNSSGYYQSLWKTESGADFANFEYRIEKQYMRQPSQTPGSSSEDFAPCDSTSTDPTIACSPGTKLIRITVTVERPDGNTYTTFGLVTG